MLSIFQKHILILEKNNLNAPEVYDVINVKFRISNRKNDRFFGIAVTTQMLLVYKSDALNTYTNVD